ncbi:MAG: type II secretion system F family protein [Pseudomonadota bacterium]
MQRYSYKATDTSGKVVTDFMEADTEQEVVAFLQDSGLIPIRISRVTRKGFGFLASPSLNSDLKSFFRRVSVKDVMFFTQDLSALLASGLPVDRSLKILVQAAENESFKDVVSDLLRSIESGSDLSSAMAKHPRAFSEFYVNMIKAGEAGGVLEPVLDRLGVFLESSQELKEYVTSAMVYPIFLVGVGGLSIIVLMTFVIPKFAIIFKDMGQAVPWSAALLLSISHVLRSYWWALGGGFIAVIMAIRYYAGTPAGGYQMDTWKLRLPILGDLVRKVEVGRVARTLGTLVNSGVPILDALLLVREIIGNRLIADAMGDVYNRVKEGEELSRPLGDSGMFPSLAIQMIRVGEETGRLSEMLLRVADNYEKIVRNAVKRATSLLEPTMILIMGVVVGSIVISMLMAIFSMNDLPF